MKLMSGSSYNIGGYIACLSYNGAPLCDRLAWIDTVDVWEGAGKHARIRRLLKDRPFWGSSR